MSEFQAVIIYGSTRIPLIPIKPDFLGAEVFRGRDNHNLYFIKDSKVVGVIEIREHRFNSITSDFVDQRYYDQMEVKLECV